MSRPQNRFPIVGIGASAGGIPAMEQFFKAMPADPGMAFIIVTHLNPERESILHEVLQRYTAMEVSVAGDDQRIEINHVYVMPQNTTLNIKNGILQSSQGTGKREPKPVDVFFSSLAIDQREYAVGVVLSGGDSDGTLGVKAIKEHGGLTVAQTGDGSGPLNPGMPQSAIKAGLIDISTSAEDMGSKLVAFARSFDLLDTLADGEPQDASGSKASQEIYGLLRNSSGHDFSGYKTKTFLRRVNRRMQVRQATTIEDYVTLLKSDAEEVANLFRDLLINVTNFFRDLEAFESLEKEIMPQLFESKGAVPDMVRVWVPGCSTGEEVYSLAIVLREYMEKASTRVRVKIFATDIDESALGVARAGRYPEALMEGISSERKARFFQKEGTAYVVAKEVRDLCVFSPHNLIEDPPFSRMDLVSCRNLLIYFGQDLQNQVIPAFHYALKPGGYLFLGTSESIGQHQNLFATVNKKHRIFKAQPYSGSPYRFSVPARHDNPIMDVSSDSARANRYSTALLKQGIEAQVLERFSPAHVVVNADGDIVYYSAHTGKYLEAQQGVPSRQILGMARKGLRLDLRAALREAATTGKRVVRDHVALDDDAAKGEVARIIVDPLADRRIVEPLYIVLFEPIPADAAIEPDTSKWIELDASADLERELREVRDRLQSTVEEYETALEELKSSNEELVSVNEEAQSTNEELEASKEEMQSLNEELNTINAELNTKVEELDRANNDLKNLFSSTEIATVFLDRDLVIRNFTPAARSFFNLRPHDVGRPLTDLSSILAYPELKSHIDAVFKTGKNIDHHLDRDKHGCCYLARLIPYRGDNERVDGVTFTLIDVTSIAEAEEHQRVLISELNHRVKNMLAVTIALAGQALDPSVTLEQYHAALVGRLQAMSRAHALLSSKQWKRTPIKVVLETILSPYDAKSFHIEGSDVLLPPYVCLALSMVFHELATNAAKYGALSDRNGKIDVGWKLAGETVVLDWRESGGPEAKTPDRSGFGSSLIRGEIEYRLQGSVKTEFTPGGLEVHIEFPLGTGKEWQQ